MTAGYVSYFSGDPKHFPKKRIIFQYHNLGSKQIEYLNKLKRKKGIQQQQYYNIVQPLNVREYDQLEDYGKKLWDILESIQFQKGKIFIYSDMLSHGLIPIQHFLEKQLKYVIADKPNIKTEKKRYILWTGGGDADLQHRLLEKFNSNNNLNGDIIQILLGSTSIMEGVNLKAVKHVHILNPWWNESRIDQVIGRAVRQNSHQSLPVKERFVNIYRHIVVTDGENYEKHVQEVSNDKKEKAFKFERWLKEVAVDCSIYSSENKKITTEEHYFQHEPGSEIYDKYNFNPSTRQTTLVSNEATDDEFEYIPTCEILPENINCSVGGSVEIPKGILQITKKIKTIGPSIANYLLDKKTDANKLNFIREFVNCLDTERINYLNNITNIKNKDIAERNEIIQKLIACKPDKDKRVLERLLMGLSLKELKYQFK